MKVWPRGKYRDRGVRRRPSVDLANWVLGEEKFLVETRFGGDAEQYGAWRDGLWAEMHELMRRPGQAKRQTADDEYVVMTAFDGDWAQYRICRDRLREELWQIMKVTKRR